MITASITIANALPGLVPTLRDYDMGQWPQSKMKMRNGRVQRWGLSSIPTGDKMRLVWENITYAQAESLCIVWDQNYGIYGEVLLPPETLAGTNGGLATLMATPFAGATWQFTGPPKVVPVKARRCTVEMPIGVRGFVRQDLSVGDGTDSGYDGLNTCADDDGSGPVQVVFVTSRSIGFPGAIDVTNGGWGTFLNQYAISFRTSNANGATDSSSAFFTALSPGTYTVIATADDSGTLVVNGQSCAVSAFFEGPDQTNVTISAAGPVPVTIEIINGIASSSFSLNPMGIAFTIEGPI